MSRRPRIRARGDAANRAIARLGILGLLGGCLTASPGHTLLACSYINNYTDAAYGNEATVARCGMDPISN